MEKLENFKSFFEEMKNNGLSKKDIFTTLLQEINENFNRMNNSFSQDIIEKLKKYIENAETAEKVKTCLLDKNYNELNIEKKELGEFSIANGAIEEALCILIEKYKKEKNESKKEKMLKRLIPSCLKISGKEGTTGKAIDMLDLDALKKLIRYEAEVDDLHTDELIEILCRKINTSIDPDELEELVRIAEDTVVVAAANTPDKVESAKIFKLFEILAKDYSNKSNQENREAIEERLSTILDTADKVCEEIKNKYGEKSEKYKTACDECFNLKRMTDPTITSENLEDLLRNAEIHNPQELDTRSVPPGPVNPHEPVDNKIMSREDKIKYIQGTIKELQKEHPEMKISLGKKAFLESEPKSSFDGYYIIPIEGIHTYILEKFDDNVSSSLFVASSEDISKVYDIMKKKRNLVKLEDCESVVSINHSGNFAGNLKHALEVNLDITKLSQMWDEADALDKKISNMPKDNTRIKYHKINSQSKYHILDKKMVNIPDDSVQSKYHKIALQSRYHSLFQEIEKLDKKVEIEKNNRTKGKQRNEKRIEGKGE